MDHSNDPITVEKTADGYRAAIQGAIHLNTARIESELKKIMAAKPKRVELDLGKMPFASSIGLAVLISFRNSVVTGGGVFKITAIQERVLGTVRFARLEELMNIDASTIVLKAAE